MSNLLSSLSKTIHVSAIIAILLFLGMFFQNDGFSLFRNNDISHVLSLLSESSRHFVPNAVVFFPNCPLGAVFSAR